MTPAGRIASLSVDLTNRWSIQKMRGNQDWKWLPSYFPALIPRLLHFLSKKNLRATFFVVGQDAGMREHRDLLHAIAAEGHEIGNHSLSYESSLQNCTLSEIETEITQSEEQIGAATGQLTKGFRGPGHHLSRSALEFIAKRGYLYDSSTFPTAVGPIARRLFLSGTNLSQEQKRERRHLFGGWADAVRPVRPYVWQLRYRRILEIPVTTVPGVHLPFHLSYLNHLATFSTSMATSYLRGALSLCRAAGIDPSFVLNPIDFAVPEDAPEVSHLRSMQVSLNDKLRFADLVLGMLQSEYRVVRMDEHAHALLTRKDLHRVEPDLQLP